MLTPDLVRAHRRGDELHVPRLVGQQRDRALDIAAQLLEAARATVGATRDELRDALGGVDIVARERRLRDGLAKLVEDGCEFAVDESVDPIELRRDVFSRASVLRSEHHLDRSELVGRVAAERGLDVERLERALYADLRGAHQLLAAPSIAAPDLLVGYEQAEVQAVLLRAIKVSARVFCRSPAAYRDLLRQLKFRRLLFTVTPLDRGYQLEIDGPLSLFESVTKYGLSLALALPALQTADELDLEAQVRWGKQRKPLRFRIASRAPAVARPADPPPPGEIAALIEAFATHDSGWRASVADRILELPGVGLCIPDLVFQNPELPSPVYFELLGYWSREAVWRRVELVQRGLEERILFAASSRLRVSEDVLSDEDRGALVVFKGTLGARQVARKLDELVGR
jgi:uncharacterized protein